MYSYSFYYDDPHELIQITLRYRLCNTCSGQFHNQNDWSRWKSLNYNIMIALLNRFRITIATFDFPLNSITVSEIMPPRWILVNCANVDGTNCAKSANVKCKVCQIVLIYYVLFAICVICSQMGEYAWMSNCIYLWHYFTLPYLII